MAQKNPVDSLQIRKRFYKTSEPMVLVLRYLREAEFEEHRALALVVEEVLSAVYFPLALKKYQPQNDQKGKDYAISSIKFLEACIERIRLRWGLQAVAPFLGNAIAAKSVERSSDSTETDTSDSSAALEKKVERFQASNINQIFGRAGK